jgi:hypothetical protein
MKRWDEPIHPVATSRMIENRDAGRFGGPYPCYRCGVNDAVRDHLCSNCAARPIAPQPVERPQIDLFAL